MTSNSPPPWLLMGKRRVSIRLFFLFKRVSAIATWNRTSRFGLLARRSPDPCGRADNTDNSGIWSRTNSTDYEPAISENIWLLSAVSVARIQNMWAQRLLPYYTRQTPLMSTKFVFQVAAALCYPFQREPSRHGSFDNILFITTCIGLILRCEIHRHLIKRIALCKVEQFIHANNQIHPSIGFS